MTPWIIEDSAAIAAGVGIFAAAAWKIWLRIRHDNRTDSAESWQSRGYDAIIAQLREEVDRLATQVKNMSADLDYERRARYEAQQSEARLKLRIEHLELQVRSLGGTI